MIRRHWPVLAFAAAFLAIGLNLQAQPPAKKADTPPVPTDFNTKELSAKQQATELQYKGFTRSLLTLAQKLEKSERLEDKDKAKTLRRAIELADKEGVDNRFVSLVRTVTKNGEIGISDLTSAAGQNEELIKILIELRAILESDDELARIQAEIALLNKHLADLNSIVRNLKIVQARTDSKKGDPNTIAKAQRELANQTNNLADRMGAKKEDKPAANSPSKGDNKAEGKPGEEQGKEKEDTDKPKGEESKEPSDPKKGAEGSESKPSQGPKDGEGSKSSKGGPPKEGGSKGSPMGGEPKKNDDQQAKKPAESRNKEDNKGEQKGSASKTPPPKDQQASSKNSGSPSASNPSGAPKPPSSGSPSSSSPPPSNSPPKPPAPGAENVRKAVPDEENAASNLDENKRPKASENQTEANNKLEQAQQELEKRLKQLREKELEKLLANLENRVNKMLGMQIEVKGATVSIDAQIKKSGDPKPKQIDFQNAQKQEDREAEIISEADKAIDLLKNEGSAVAFPAVFEEVRVDMVRVRERLHNANVGQDTQDLEEDIIVSLTHMRDALKKAQQELGKTPPPPPGGPPPDAPQLQKLLDEIAELKMIRQLQTQVNDRTIRYGKRTPGEQSEDLQTRKELRDLSERQEKIETMVHNLATKKNQ
jgi:hypothetical protein